MALAGMVTSTVGLDYILWRTRGLHWDYEFVLEPAAPHSAEGWFWMHRAAFEGVVPGRDPMYVVGSLENDGEAPVEFVGTAFLDDQRTDVHGRPVAHYVIWFKAVESAGEIVSTTPRGWERAFLGHVESALDSPGVFDAPPSGQPDAELVSLRVLADELKSLGRVFDVTGPPIQGADCRNVGAVKKKPPPNRRPRSSRPKQTSVWRLALPVVMLTLLLGMLLLRTCTSHLETTPPAPVPTERHP